jgi:hypothetical protein
MRCRHGWPEQASVAKALAREGEMNGFFEPDRVAMIYTADHLDDARAVGGSTSLAVYGAYVLAAELARAG